MNSNIDSIKALTDYLSANNLNKTLETLRAELLKKIPPQPSNQLLSIIRTNNQQPPYPTKKKSIKQMKKQEVENTMHRLVNRLAANSKIINDSQTNEKIEKMMDQKVFQRLVENTKVFDNESMDQSKSNFLQFEDELDMVVGPEKHVSTVQIPIQNGLQYKPRKERNPNDQYASDDDPGYTLHRFFEIQLSKVNCGQIGLLGIQTQMPKQVILVQQPKFAPIVKKLPESINHPKLPPNSSFPIQNNGIIYSCMDLKVIYNRQKTGYEQSRQFPIAINDVIAGRYQIISKLGSGAFASAVEVKDLKQNGRITCLKIFSQLKQSTDQGFDEVRLLKLINNNCNTDQKYLLKFYSSFYHREHLFIQTQLLKQDLLKTYINYPEFFTIPILKKTAKMLFLGLEQLHKMHIIHCDLKPENILIKSYQPYSIKIVDMGNASFFHDDFYHLYMQSRNYRAPELLLGIQPTGKIDIWSVGCIIAELWLKKVLWKGQIPQMLARMQGILGPWPSWMLEFDKVKNNEQQIRFTHQCSRKFLYQKSLIAKQDIYKMNNPKQYRTIVSHLTLQIPPVRKQLGNAVPIVDILIPKQSNLNQRIRCDDSEFVKFLEYIFQVDPQKRPSASEALKHPFLANVNLQ